MCGGVRSGLAEKVNLAKREERNKYNSNTHTHTKKKNLDWKKQR